MSRPFTSDDERHMRRALALAIHGQGYVEPNPMVGCVIVRSGRVIGEGWHRRFGGPHAEVEALRAAGASASGATAYVTLEPCCHFGKTPPCTDALIEAGITHVVAAMRDPFPKVRGRGQRLLRAAGIDVRMGLCEADAMLLNAPYLKRQRTGRPWVILKWAQSLDGKIATRTGDSKWISGEASRALAHEIRGRVDAVIVGVGTVLADDPQLTCRCSRPRRIAARVVLDPHLRTPPNAQLVKTVGEAPTLIVTDRRLLDSPAALRLARRGVDLIGLPLLESGEGRGTRVEGRGRNEETQKRKDAKTGQGSGVRGQGQGAEEGRAASGSQLRAHSSQLPLATLLDELGAWGMTNVMVEGGGRTLGGFWDAGLADEAVVFVSRRFIGGAAAPSPLSGLGPAMMRDVSAPVATEIAHRGDDDVYRLVYTRVAR